MNNIDKETILAFLIRFKEIEAQRIAQHVGVSKQLVSFWVIGRRHIQQKYIPKIAEVLDVAPIIIENGLAIEERLAMEKTKLMSKCAELGVDFNSL